MLFSVCIERILFFVLQMWQGPFMLNSEFTPQPSPIFAQLFRNLLFSAILGTLSYSCKALTGKFMQLFELIFL